MTAEAYVMPMRLRDLKTALMLCCTDAVDENGQPAAVSLPQGSLDDIALNVLKEATGKTWAERAT